MDEIIKKAEELETNFKEYYEKHPYKFVEDYLGVKLKCYEKCVLKIMSLINKN